LNNKNKKIKELPMKKGGLNEKPTTSRPKKPPKSQPKK